MWFASLYEKLIASDKTTDFLTKKNYIYKNISSELDDQDISDLLVLTNSRMGKDSKFEDVVKEVAEKRGFSKIKKKKWTIIIRRNRTSNERFKISITMWNLWKMGKIKRKKYSLLWKS